VLYLFIIEEAAKFFLEKYKPEKDLALATRSCIQLDYHRYAHDPVVY
jgi:hypothetical protein